MTQETPIYKDPKQPVEARVRDLLSRMTLEEKADQLLQGLIGKDVNPNNLGGENSFRPTIGSILSYYGGSKARNAFQRIAVENTRLGIPIHEYAPMKIKMAITGMGQASKEQVAAMLQRILKIAPKDMCDFMDATDALAAAYCHFMQLGRPAPQAHYSGWKDFVNKNRERVCNH